MSAPERLSEAEVEELERLGPVHDFTRDVGIAFQMAAALPRLLAERRELREALVGHTELLRCFRAAKRIGLNMRELPIEAAIGESGRDMIDACWSAAIDYENATMDMGEAERLYEASRALLAPAEGGETDMSERKVKVSARLLRDIRRVCGPAEPIRVGPSQEELAGSPPPVAPKRKPRKKA